MCVKNHKSGNSNQVQIDGKVSLAAHLRDKT